MSCENGVEGTKVKLSATVLVICVDKIADLLLGKVLTETTQYGTKIFCGNVTCTFKAESD